ncbi:MAG: hypothetical protein WCJ70_00955 [bacterium]
MFPSLYRKLKILSIIGVSLLLSNQIDNTFFIAHSPTVNMAAVERFTHPEIPPVDTQYIASLFARPSAPQAQTQSQLPKAELPVKETNAQNQTPILPTDVLHTVLQISPTPAPTLAPRAVDFVANSSVGEQKALLRSNGFTEVSASVFYKNDGVVEEIVLPPAVQYGSSTATGEDGGEITVLSPL